MSAELVEGFGAANTDDIGIKINDNTSRIDVTIIFCFFIIRLLYYVYIYIYVSTKKR